MKIYHTEGNYKITLLVARSPKKCMSGHLPMVSSITYILSGDSIYRQNKVVYIVPHVNIAACDWYFLFTQHCAYMTENHTTCQRRGEHTYLNLPLI